MVRTDLRQLSLTTVGQNLLLLSTSKAILTPMITCEVANPEGGGFRAFCFSATCTGSVPNRTRSVRTLCALLQPKVVQRYSLKRFMRGRGLGAAQLSPVLRPELKLHLVSIRSSRDKLTLPPGTLPGPLWRLNKFGLVVKHWPQRHQNG